MTAKKEVIMTREAKRSQWEERIKAHELSGKSAGEFCRDQGIGLDTLRYWLAKLRGKNDEKPGVSPLPPTRFTRVELIRPLEPLAVSVRLPGGVVVEAPGGYPDPSWIRAIVSALTEAGFR